MIPTPKLVSIFIRGDGVQNHRWKAQQPTYSCLERDSCWLRTSPHDFSTFTSIFSPFPGVSFHIFTLSGNIDGGGCRQGIFSMGACPMVFPSPRLAPAYPVLLGQPLNSEAPRREFDGNPGNDILEAIKLDFVPVGSDDPRGIVYHLQIRVVWQSPG